jgi:hypothetical protein
MDWTNLNTGEETWSNDKEGDTTQLGLWVGSVNGGVLNSILCLHGRAFGMHDLAIWQAGYMTLLSGPGFVEYIVLI